MARDLIVFDMDGVLVDVSESYRESIVQTVKHFTGREITRSAIQDYKNSGGWNNDWALSQRIIQDFGGDVDYDRLVEVFNLIFLGNGSGNEGLIAHERWIAEPGMLEDLSESFDFGIFTGRLRMEADITLERFASTYRFDPIVAAEDVVRAKPAPDGLLQIADRCPSRKLWYVGDTVDDARSAKAAGVAFVGIAAPGSPRRNELESLLWSEGAIAVLPDINTLESALK
jgi:HAD superfamily hydrolase (TIGR01548 family)